MRKNYVLDANILIHDPQSIFHFADNTVVIPIGVISEIDRFKKEMTDRGYNARAVVRLLDGLRGDRSLAEGVPLENGGRLLIYCDPQRVLEGLNGSADLEILRVARAIKEQDPAAPVVIVTKDINLRIRADAVGITAQDYESDRVRLADVCPEQRERTLSEGQMTAFRDQGEVAIDGPPMTPNEYLLLRPPNGDRKTALARVSADGTRLLAITQPERGLCGVSPRNKEQYFAVDALLDDSLQLITLMGKAGTGKTLLAVAAALYMATKRHKQFRQVVIARPVVPLGRDLGYLPGDVSKKLEPWMKPITDTIEFLLHGGASIRGHADAAGLMRSGLIEIQPLTYIRGRSIAGSFVVIDEAQNLTPLEVKTVITRIGAGSRVVLTGDPFQIDNPYVDAGSNGFTYLVNRFRGQPMAAHIHLHKGERSELAELAANIL